MKDTVPLKNRAIAGITPNKYTAVSEQRVSMDSRHPLTKQWHRRHANVDKKIHKI